MPARCHRASIFLPRGRNARSKEALEAIHEGKWFFSYIYKKEILSDVSAQKVSVWKDPGRCTGGIIISFYILVLVQNRNKLRHLPDDELTVGVGERRAKKRRLRSESFPVTPTYYRAITRSRPIQPLSDARPRRDIRGSQRGTASISRHFFRKLGRDQLLTFLTTFVARLSFSQSGTQMSKT